jgi:hypothetical protein
MLRPRSCRKARIEDTDRFMMIFNNADHASQIRLDLTKTPLANASHADAEMGAPTGQLSQEFFDVSAPPRTVVVYAME